MCVSTGKTLHAPGREKGGLACAKQKALCAQGLGPTCDGEGTCSTHVPLGLMDPVRARVVLEMVPRKSAEEVQRTLAKAHHIDICGCATRAQGDVNTSPFVCSLTPKFHTNSSPHHSLPPKFNPVQTRTCVHAHSCTKRCIHARHVPHAHCIKRTTSAT